MINDLAQRALVAPAEDHAAEARIDRQPAELLAESASAAVVVERAELLEHAIALVDRALLRRIEEREALDVAEAERLHAQDHAGEADALDLRIGVRGPRREVLLLVEPEADAARGAAAAALALIGARLRDRLDLELRDAGARVVAIDARDARCRRRRRCPGIVSDVSATFVASTTRRCGSVWNTRCCSAGDSRA